MDKAEVRREMRAAANMPHPWIPGARAELIRAAADLLDMDLADVLASADDLEPIKRAYLREETIRRVMAETRWTREIVAEQIDAYASADMEAVTDLMDGHPTTLRDALMRYTDELAKRDELQPRNRVIGELGALLAYPWSEG